MKRYRHLNSPCCRSYGWLAEKPDGEWMRFEDHSAALAAKDAEIERLRAELALERKRPSKPLHLVLREAREAAGYSLEEVAKMAGLSKSQVWDIETGRNANPTLQTIRGLTRALGLRPAEWFGS